ncbi:MAG: histidinol-phosphatase [Planctomycetes bacterium]|nr:histidinol-phosphatase [Planctomycetota bacterium]
MGHMTEYRDFALELADEARAILRRRFRSRFALSWKDDGTPVTEADHEVEGILRREIHGRFPGHGIIGEEGGRSREDAEFVWVLDPIDGTKAFATGKPLFGTLIALLRDGEPVLGIIEIPILSERFVGARGEASTLNGDPIRVRERAKLSECVLYSTTPDMFAGASEAAFQRLRSRVQWSLYGGDCYSYGMLARGDIDLVVERDLKAYDCCALVPVIRGAGGVIMRWSGGAVGLDADDTLIAAGCPARAEEVRALLSGQEAQFARGGEETDDQESDAR